MILDWKIRFADEYTCGNFLNLIPKGLIYSKSIKIDCGAHDNREYKLAYITEYRNDKLYESEVKKYFNTADYDVFDCTLKEDCIWCGKDNECLKCKNFKDLKTGCKECLPKRYRKLDKSESCFYDCPFKCGDKCEDNTGLCLIDCAHPTRDIQKNCECKDRYFETPNKPTPHCISCEDIASFCGECDGITCTSCLGNRILKIDKCSCEEEINTNPEAPLCSKCSEAVIDA